MKEISEKLESMEEVLQQLVNKTKALEERQPDLTPVKIPDHSTELQNIKTELQHIKAELKITIQQHINQNNLQNEVKAQIKQVTQKIEGTSQKQIRQYRFLLFPETNAGYYYKIVFGRLIPWGLLIIVITYIFSLGEKSIEAWQNYRYNQQTEQCVRSWMYMNDHASKQVKKTMDQAWYKSEKK